MRPVTLTFTSMGAVLRAFGYRVSGILYKSQVSLFIIPYSPLYPIAPIPLYYPYTPKYKNSPIPKYPDTLACIYNEGKTKNEKH